MSRVSSRGFYEEAGVAFLILNAYLIKNLLKVYYMELSGKNNFELTSQQRQAVEHGGGPLLIVAGAGTGKTMVLTRRIAHLVNLKMAKPEEILALTFTEKAAEEMSERVDLLLPYGFANIPILTFHAFGDAVLREFALELGLNPDFQVLSQAEQFIFFKDHLFEFPLKLYRPLSNPTKFIQAVLTVISRAKDEDIDQHHYLAYADKIREKSSKDPGNKELKEEAAKQTEIAGTYLKYQELLAEHGKVDFGDQVNSVLKLLRQSPAILKKVQKRYKFILVDEFQDTNYAQFQLIRLLGEESNSITVVGDDDQSIYKFRGAAISNILNFMDIYPNAKQIVLTENFRSTQVILDTAYRLIRHNNPDRLEVKNKIDKQLSAQITEGIPVEHIHCDSLTTESDRVTSIILDLKENQGFSYNDFSILVRTNNSADPFIRALNMKDIPWYFSGNRGLYSRPEVKLLISFMKVITNPDDTANLFHLMSSDVYEIGSMKDLYKCLNTAHNQNKPLYSIINNIEDEENLNDLSAETVTSIAKIVEDIKEFREKSRNYITGSLLYEFLISSNYLKRLTQTESLENSLRIKNIARFFDVVWSFAQVAAEDRIVHFVHYLDLMIQSGDDPGIAEADSDVDAVNIMTIHKAKGLEWPVVFMISLVHNKFPLKRRSNMIELPQELIIEALPEKDMHMQEERRLFYVGMTRAEKRLYFTSAKDYGGKRRRKVSPFILEALDRPLMDTVNKKSSAMEKIERFAPTRGNIPEMMNVIPENSVLNLSYYQVDDYNSCPLKYKYTHVLHLPFFHHTLVYGKAVHSAVERYYNYKINDIPLKLEDLIEAYTNAWKNIGFLSREHEEKRFDAGKEAIKRFYEHEEKARTKPLMVEEKFSFMIENNRIAGRWDLIEERDDKIVIADFKTSEIYDQKKADTKTRKSSQLIIYAMAYRNINKADPDMLELRFIESGLRGTTQVTEKNLQKVRQEILTAAEGIRKRDYTPNPNYFNCKYCAYTGICPVAQSV